MARPRLDLGFVVAVAWLLFAALITVIYGPNLGLRGLLWMGLHHTLCAAGAGHELWRARARRRAGPSPEAPR